MNGRRKLDFLIAGAQKGGTCTLDAIFRKHPQVQMASRKETHFFDDESHNWEAPDYDKLDAYFPASDHRLRGEATPITLYWRPAIRRVHQYNPDIKLILLLRNPVERAFSQWRQVQSKGRDTTLFSDAIREGRDRVQSEAEIEGLHRHFSYVDRGFYGRQLSYLLNYFPRQQIHCEVSEEFFGDQAATLQRLSSFLAIRPFPALPQVHKNRGSRFFTPTVSADDAAYLWELFREDIAAVEAFLGRPVPEWENASTQARAKSPARPRSLVDKLRGLRYFS
jgi:Sulfotransferase domain